MVEIEKEYIFAGSDGKASLLDLFEGRRQLIVYHFMFAPGVDGWPKAGCDGCSFVADQIGHLAHLHARDTSLVLVSRAPLANIQRYKKRMGWTVPWYSSHRSDFNVDFGLTTDEGETFGLSVFLRDGRRVFRTYFTTRRGVEALGSAWTFLDLTPFGRQEDWEDSPKGWPQTRRTSGGGATMSTARSAADPWVVAASRLIVARCWWGIDRQRSPMEASTVGDPTRSGAVAEGPVGPGSRRGRPRGRAAPWRDRVSGPGSAGPRPTGPRRR
jgi:predicted dithiol-disulfide oxidoreductase (DUF899 family)